VPIGLLLKAEVWMLASPCRMWRGTMCMFCQAQRKGAKGRGKIGGRPRLPRTRASLLTGRTCDW
jgi:hypothetical protein